MAVDGATLIALWPFLFISAFIGNSTSLAADYKPEFKMSLVVNQEKSWAQAAKRFGDAVRYRTQGRIQLPTASRSRPLAGWLRPALSRQARSAREEAELNETWQLVSGIAADGFPSSTR
jgi:hypothetical protein